MGIRNRKVGAGSSDTGQALVEFALVLPIFIWLVFGMIDFGRVLNAQLMVQNASRAGARAASIAETDSQIQQLVAQDVSSVMASHLTVSIQPTQSQRTSGKQTSVTVSYPVSLSTPVLAQMMSNPFVVTSTTVMTVE